MAPVIETEGLTRSFGARVAVDHLDLQVGAGEVFGLLGPNGAGKTTTIRMLTTLLAPTGGSGRVCGFDISTQARDVRRHIGYVMRKIAWRGFLRGRESVEVEAALYHVPRATIRSRAEQVLDMVGMMPHADRVWTEYSGGMQKRLDLACGLLHKPELLVLDDPRPGIDVQTGHRAREPIRGLQSECVTISPPTNELDEL